MCALASENDEEVIDFAEAKVMIESDVRADLLYLIADNKQG